MGGLQIKTYKWFSEKIIESFLLNHEFLSEVDLLETCYEYSLVRYKVMENENIYPDKLVY